MRGWGEESRRKMARNPYTFEFEALLARCAEAEERIVLLETHTRELGVIRRFATAMLDVEGDVTTILWHLATEVMGALDLEDCVIYLREGDWLHQRAAFGPKNPDGAAVFQPIRIRVGEGVVGAAAATGQPQMVDDTRLDPRYIVDDEMRLSELAVPLVVDGVVEGVIDSEHSRPGFYTAWHVNLFSALASIASARISRASRSAERRRLVDVDPLSGLLTRQAFLRRTGEALAEGEVAVLFLDIDRFGMVNDAYGHAAGDRVLGEVGRRIANEAGPGGLVARTGADDFVVATHPDAALSLAQRVRAAISAPLALPDGGELTLSSSIGIALGRARGAEAVLNEADIAFTEVKRMRPGEIGLFDPDAASRLRGRWRITSALARALDADSPALDVHFQPIYSLADGQLVGAEALARWTDPRLGPISPAEFVTAAEESGQILALGRLVRRRAFAHLRTIHDLCGLCVSVNISAVEVRLEGFADELAAEVRDAGLPRSALALELTETALVGGEARAVANLEALANAGFALVLDDFGTGYASMSSLVDHPFASVKIDRQFVAGLGTRPKDTAVVRGILSLAHAMGLSVTAEGVETAEQAAQLRELDCARAQGWVFGRPMPVERFAALVAACPAGPWAGRRG